jgi:hypothetical protein
MSVANDEPGRSPLSDVRRQLRRESGFVCAHPDCNVPYLEYHHLIHRGAKNITTVRKE